MVMGVLPIVNSKYLPLTLWIILLVVCLVVAGFSDFNLVMIGIDLAMVIALLPIRKEINTQMNKKESKKILKRNRRFNGLQTLFCFLFCLSSL